MASSGSIVTRANVTSSMKKYGRAPTATSPKLTSPLVIPCKTYRFMPTGGVIIPHSPVITSIAPNQKGSAPMLIIRGKTNGSVINSIEKKSKKHPSTRYSTYMNRVMTKGDNPISCTATTSAKNYT